MTLEDLGYHNDLELYRSQKNLDSFQLARVILEHKERYIIKSPEGEFDAELIGNLRFSAESRTDFPAVGDWVAYMEFDKGKAIIQHVFPRKSMIERKAVGKSGQTQIIASNVDYGIIVQAMDRDFNLNRIERYLTICYASKITPLILLNKVDLITETELEDKTESIKKRIGGIKILAVSIKEKGYHELEAIIEKGKTYCLLGSSGVGKSTIVNALSENERMKTGEISTSVNKGKHVTSHRELVILKNGGILIDNPGMREVGITNSTEGLETTFDKIKEFSAACLYKNCSHTHEAGCAVTEAVRNGEIEKNAYSNYLKMEKEKSFFESDLQERRKKDKDLGKWIKQFKKQRNSNKY
jgi:ribosome biogenesis GTPase